MIVAPQQLHKLKAFLNGHVTFEGTIFTAVNGLAEDEFCDADIATIQDAFRSKRFFDLPATWPVSAFPLAAPEYEKDRLFRKSFEVIFRSASQRTNSRAIFAALAPQRCETT